MNEHELEAFEQELRSMALSPPPADFMARLTRAEPVPAAPRPQRAEPPRLAPGWTWLLRWLVPATAIVVAGGLAWFKFRAPAPAPTSPALAATPATIKADSVRLDEQLVGSFYAVARLPSGEPVRLRCRQWMDNLTVRDKDQGLVIQQRTPRVEVVPVRFETY